MRTFTAIELHGVGVVAAPWLCDIGVLADAQLDDTEAAPGSSLRRCCIPLIPATATAMVAGPLRPDCA